MAAAESGSGRQCDRTASYADGYYWPPIDMQSSSSALIARPLFLDTLSIVGSVAAPPMVHVGGQEG